MCDDQWISGREAGRVLGVNPRVVRRIAKQVGIRSCTYPWVRGTKYHRGDTLTVAAEFTRDPRLDAIFRPSRYHARSGEEAGATGT